MLIVPGEVTGEVTGEKATGEARGGASSLPCTIERGMRVLTAALQFDRRRIILGLDSCGVEADEEKQSQSRRNRTMVADISRPGAKRRTVEILSNFVHELQEKEKEKETKREEG